MQLFDALPAHIEDALRASIRRFGVLVPITVDQHGEVLDGHHRKRIAEELRTPFDRLVRVCESEEERREIARTLNADRRQLTEEQRREVAVELRQQGHSYRAIGGALGASHTQIRKDVEAARLESGFQSEPERVLRQGGGSYPARRPQPAPNGDIPVWGSVEGRTASVLRCSVDSEHLAARETFEDVGGCPYCMHTAGERQAALAARESLLRRLDDGVGRRPTVIARNDREQERAQEALTTIGDDAPARTLDVKRVERMAREKVAEDRRAQPVDPVTVVSDVDIRHGDFRDIFADIEPGAVDAIITDPPYPREFVPLFEDLSALAARILKPDGVLAVMTGQSHLPAYIDLLSKHMRYRWTGAYIVQGPRNRVHAARVGTGWKPILIYSHPDAGELPFLLDDLFDSAGDDKRFHHWGQSESGIAALVERLTKPGDLVCDPFLGGGTAAVVCKDLGRRFIGCDIDAGHVATSRERVA